MKVGKSRKTLFSVVLNSSVVIPTLYVPQRSSGKNRETLATACSALAACFGKLLHSSIILLAKDVHHPTDYSVQAT
jgi:hypothetical protein